MRNGEAGEGEEEIGEIGVELTVGDHHKVKRRLGIWLRPDLWAFVNFLNFIDSSKPLARSQKSPSQEGKAVALNKVCSRIVSTPPRAWITSVL